MRRSAPNQHQQSLDEHIEWEWHFTQLTDFIRRHGHSDLGPHPVTDWLLRQRHAAHRNEISARHRRSLLDLGIDLSQPPPAAPDEPDDDEPPLQRAAKQFADLWELRYAGLCAYQAEHGHTNVTKAQNLTLSHWRSSQTQFRRKGTLSPERIARLDAIGFVWEAPGRGSMPRDQWHQHRWDVQFQHLTAFIDRFGHCHVPVVWEENRQLGEWVAEQRDQARHQRLPADRRQRLDILGFVWKPQRHLRLPPFRAERAPRRKSVALWETRFAEMCAYQAEYGHTNVTTDLSN